MVPVLYQKLAEELLNETLMEEKDTDALLTEIAMSEANLVTA